MKKIPIFEKIFLILLFIVCLSGVVKAQFFENLQQYIDKIGGINVRTTTTILKTTPSFYFSKTLRVGDENFDVLQLQKLLATDKNIYPEGLTTGFFGSLTKRAVIKFQEKYASDVLWPLGLTKGTGLVGKATIKKLNALTNNISNTPVTYNNTIPSNKIVDCADNGDRALVCSLNKTGQIVTMPNKCFSDQAGYVKLCDGACPCRTNTSSTTIFTDTPDTTKVEYFEDTTTTSIAQRYSCSNGSCIANPTGAFITSNCNNMCSKTARYACNDNGVCTNIEGGPYTTSNCDNECKPTSQTGKLLEEIYYDKSKVNGTCVYTEDITGDFHYATLSEDKLFYPALKIKSPVSYKSYLTLNKSNFPQTPVDKCCNFGWITICLKGGFIKDSGFEIINNIDDLNKFFYVSDSSIFTSDFFNKNVLVFVYDVTREEDADCKYVVTDFKVDRIVYDAPDLDEIAATNDTTPYNYRLPKYYQVIVKVKKDEIVDNNNVCALKCQSGPKYNFDVISIAKEDLKKIDGTYKKITVDVEGIIKWSSLHK